MNVNEYQRLFNHRGLRFLINEIAMKGYGGLGLVCIVRDDEFESFIPKSTIEQTSIEGIKLYGSKKEFNVFVTNFRIIYKKIVDFCENILSKTKFEVNDMKTLFDLCIEFLNEYKKTEFIYVDAAYMVSQKSNNLELKDNLKEYESVKFEFRGLINVIFLGDSSYYQRILEKLGKEFNISSEDLQQYNMKEVLELFEGKKVEDYIIKERSRINVLIDSGNFEYYWGEEAARIISAFLKDEEKDVKISGTIVNPGKATGIARIIRPSWHESFGKIKEAMEKMNQGDILVAETTSPDIMVAIKKAGAIVADQGGLMSHAAIVSREMNVPGLVATRNATKLINNGDLIEVDAHKGTVTIIKKA